MRELGGKVAVVTGGGSGIGLATARLLAEEGMHVVIADVRSSRLDEAVEQARADGIKLHAIPTDVTSYAACCDLAATVYGAYGAAHLVLLNAGISAVASLFDDDIEPWRRAVDTNLLGVVWGIKAFVPRMIADDRDGLVLATSSGAGSDGTSYGTPAYAATKIAVVSIMESLYGHLRDKGSKVTAGILFPPLTRTNLGGDPVVMEAAVGHLASKGVPTPLAQPEQVAAMAVDGIKRGRFFIRVGRGENASFYAGAHPPEFFAWNEKVVRGRADAQLGDGVPDSYLW